MTLSSILAFVAWRSAAQAPATNKVEIVSVTGCLREQGAGNWMLVAATDPVPSIANQAPAAELPKDAARRQEPLPVDRRGRVQPAAASRPDHGDSRPVHQGHARQPHQRDLGGRGRRDLRRRRAEIG